MEIGAAPTHRAGEGELEPVALDVVVDVEAEGLRKQGGVRGPHTLTPGKRLF